MSTPTATWSEQRATRPAPATGPADAAREQRLLVVARWPVGGIRTHLQYAYPALAECGHRFTFVGPADASLDGLARTLRELGDCEYVGVPVHKERCPLWSTTRRLLRSGRFGLIHSHGFTAAVHAVAANFGLGVPHLTTLHDVLRPAHFLGWRGPLKRWLLARMVRRITTVVSVSSDVQANLLEFLPSVAGGPCRLVTIPHGIDTNHYRPLDRSCQPVRPGTGLRERLGLPADTCAIGFLGRFMEQKGFTPWLLEALQRLKATGTARPFRLVAVGSDDCRFRYLREVADRGLADVVSVLDFMPDVLPVLRQLDLLVVPSLWEASSLLSMEAMAVGVPVLGSDCIGLREVLRDTPSRLVPVGDVEALSRAVGAAIARPWTAEAAAFAPVARARFDIARPARRLAELVTELVPPV